MIDSRRPIEGKGRAAVVTNVGAKIRPLLVVFTPAVLSSVFSCFARLGALRVDCLDAGAVF